MATIVTRAGKGSPLTNAEVDANFTNLNNGKVEANFSAVVAALGYTPYNATNPSNFLDQAGVRGSFSVTGDLTYNSTTGVFGVNVPVTSVAGKTGAVTLSTTDVSEGTNQYFTQARARSSISVSGSLSYNNSTGVISFTDAVTSVFGRTGAVTLTSGDVTGALGYTPPQPNGTGASGTWGISISGNAATVTNGVYTTGDQTIGGAKTFSSVVTNSAGRYTTSNTGSGMYEMHLPGIVARGWYLSSDGVTRLGITNGAGSVSTVQLSVDGSSNFTAAGNVTAFSDERLKKDWAALPSDFLKKLAYVKSGTYTRTDSGERQAGVSAQDMQAVLPEVVLGEETLSLAYGNAALVAVIELAREVLTIREKLAKIAQED